MKKVLPVLLGSIVLFTMLNSCTTVMKATYPAADDVFITSGDGNIQKPYTPVGELYYKERGIRLLPIPLVSLIPIKDVDPDLAMKTKVKEEVRNMGGDALINTKVFFQPPRFLVLWSTGGTLVIQGTVIKR